MRSRVEIPHQLMQVEGLAHWQMYIGLGDPRILENFFFALLKFWKNVCINILTEMLKFKVKINCHLTM